MPPKKESFDSGFTREDLFLLLELYRNNIEINTTLLEKTNSILEKHKETAESIQEFMKATLDIMKKINETRENNEKLQREHIHIMEKQHSNIKQHLYLLYIGLGAVLVPIIGKIIQGVWK